MKKIAIFAISAVTLSGCQLMGNSNLLNTDFNAMSCSEIKQTFVDYKNTMNTADTTTDILDAVGMDTSSVNSGKATAQDIYNQAAEIARPIMKLKGCTEYI